MKHSEGCFEVQMVSMKFKGCDNFEKAWKIEEGGLWGFFMEVFHFWQPVTVNIAASHL